MRHVRYSFSTVLLLFLLLFLSACSTVTGLFQSPLARPSATTTSTSQMVPLDLAIPQKALKPIPDSQLADTTKMHVIVSFKLNAALLNQFATNPRVRAGQSTSATTLAKQIGISQQTYQQMQAFFGGSGITLQLSKLRTSLTLDGQASAFAKQLHTHFPYYLYQSVLFYAPFPTIMLPRSIASQIQAVSGLDSYSKYVSPISDVSLQPLHAHVRSDGCINDTDVLTPQQIGQAYGLTSLYQNGWTGKGTTIILPEFDAFSRSDVQFYLDCEGFRGTLSVVTVNHTPPTIQDYEAQLDIEMIAGLAPDAHIVVYQTDPGNNYADFWPNLLDVLNRISDDYINHTQPAMVSISWGGAEGYLSLNMLRSIDSTLEILTTAEHLTVFAASGDCGAYDSVDYPTTLDVDFPASDPYVVGVGGTFLYVDAQGNRTREVSWNGSPQRDPKCDNSWGSGGGLSSVFPRPSWQQGYEGIQNKYSNGYRQVPDVSASAYYDSFYGDGQWYYSGGTSAATPMWAASFALAQQGLVSTTGYYVVGPDSLYALARQYTRDKPFYDVQKGNNLYYTAEPGWDYTSGLGTPNIYGIYKAQAQFIQA